MVKEIFIFFIRGYQKLVSPLFFPSCRFYPSCSNYAIQVLKKFGLLKGSFLLIARILKCHPLHPGGYDPVK